MRTSSECAHETASHRLPHRGDGFKHACSKSGRKLIECQACSTSGKLALSTFVCSRHFGGFYLGPILRSGVLKREYAIGKLARVHKSRCLLYILTKERAKILDDLVWRLRDVVTGAKLDGRSDSMEEATATAERVCKSTFSSFYSAS